MRYKTWSFRFAEEILNSKLSIKNELIDIVNNVNLSPKDFSRPNLNKEFEKEFLKRGWKSQEKVSDELGARIDFIKEKVGVEVAFVHSSFLGIDLLKFQTMSFSDTIDVGIYIVMTDKLREKYDLKGSIGFNKVQKYLPHFKSAIQVPIFVIGLEE
jgi:hypothetical protein